LWEKKIGWQISGWSENAGDRDRFSVSGEANLEKDCGNGQTARQLQ
jgi:hypothetical protein